MSSDRSVGSFGVRWPFFTRALTPYVESSFKAVLSCYRQDSSSFHGAGVYAQRTASQQQISTEDVWGWSELLTARSNHR